MAETRVTTNTKLIFAFIVLLYASTNFTFGSDTISVNQIIRYNDTIVSPQETFELGFFSPGNSMNYYVGIWYKKRSYGTVVWVANGDAPLTHTSGELTLTIQGVLVLQDATTGNILWNSSSKTSVKNPIGQLLDTGNFVIYEEGDNINQENHIWQSFDFLTGNFLPGIKHGRNLVMGVECHFSSRKSHDHNPATENNERSTVGIRVRVMIPIAFVVLVILLSICVFYRFNRKKQHPQGAPKSVFEHDPENRSDNEDLELPIFGLSTLLKATNNFSTNNKIGEVGYGPVYKGILEDGKEIAVKRLAKTSTQGLQEFKNEVISTSKLQHRNLVKLLGYCIEAVEKMLIYEYMPNKSLNFFIFDRTPNELIDWPTRYHIINGIARGLLYIHRDSRLRIIHRDLKASNILLDTDMNPKISDFGMARRFRGNQIEANTNRVVGTYGYMAPEYVRDGVFSIKSDIYSFGVVVLEVVSGERNRGFIHKEHYNNLMGHAWGLHNEGRSLELVAKCLDQSINVSQVLRSIHVALLCVQRRPEDRPTMTSVILMLGCEGTLPSPKEPGFYVGEGLQDTTHSYGKSSSNELTISIPDGR